MTNATQKPLGKSVSFGSESCPVYSGCTVPLCFFDKSLAQACWYPGEPVCRLRQVPKWIKTQRRIAKALGIPKDSDKGQEYYGAFTVKMLETAKRITSKIRGVDFETETEQAWLNKRRVLSVSGGITDIAKNLDAPGPSFAPSAAHQGINEGQSCPALRALTRSGLRTQTAWRPGSDGVGNGQRLIKKALT